jgi:putative hydrolase of the HAD superfamily
MLDVDGVLVDGRPVDGKQWTLNLEEDLGVAPKVLVDEFFTKHWKEVVVGKRDLMGALSESLTAASLSVKTEELVRYWFSMDSRIVRSVYDDCKAAKKQGIPVFLATNQEHNRASYLMESMDLGSIVDGIIYSAQAGNQKPHPEFYSYASRVVGFQPNQLLLVDDTAANIKGAHEAGWEAVLWDESESLGEILRRSIK